MVEIEHVKVQGKEVPKIGLGTWQLKGRTCVEAVKTALDEGYRHVDTAQAYGNEDKVGEGIRESDTDREDIFLTTKVWRDNLNRDDLVGSVEDSLDRLKTDHVDLLLIHWPFPEMNQEAVFRELEKVVEQGKADRIGVSNFNTSQMDRATEISKEKIFTNQVEYHPLLDQSEVHQRCLDLEMMLTAYSPLARGEVIGNQTLKDIGSGYGKSEAQVALRWLIQQKNVAVIPKASTAEHIRENREVFDFSLDEEEMKRISSLSRNDRKVDPDFGPGWD